jgi:uncharacterized membrane protein
LINMANLTVLKGSTYDGVQQILQKIEFLEKLEWIGIQEISIITWQTHKGQTGIEQVVSKAGSVDDRLTDIFNGEETGQQVTEMTSALFLVTREPLQDKVFEEFDNCDYELLASNLTKEQGLQFMVAFAEE